MRNVTNIALDETWDDIQAKIDADHQLAEKLQVQEQEELSIEENATLFQQLLEKRRKHFAAKRAEEKRNKPPTKAQQRKIMCTYLKNMEGYKLNDLKLKEFDSIQEMFDRAFKTQKVEDDKETVEIKKLMEIILDEEEVDIDAIPLAVKSPSIVGWKIHKDRRKSYFQIIRVDGKSHIFLMLGREKVSPYPSTLTMMLEKKLMIDYESEMAYQLLKFWKHPPAEADSATKSITFTLSHFDKPLSFNLDVFSTVIGIERSKDFVSIPPKETVKADLVTLGLTDGNDTSLSSSDLINSSLVKINPKHQLTKDKEEANPTASKPKSSKQAQGFTSKKQVDVDLSARFMGNSDATADATQSLGASESTKDQENQPQTADAEKVTVLNIRGTARNHSQTSLGESGDDTERLEIPDV
ncbi:hypothetical protein Tco_0026163 [Tanacetum coccineum]